MASVDKSDPPLARATLVTDEPACVVVPTQQSATVVTPLIASGTPGDTPHGLGAMGLGRYSARITCPFCHETCMTRTEMRITRWTIAGVVIMTMAFWPLFWLPFVMVACKATDHYCTLCNRKVGRAPECSG